MLTGGVAASGRQPLGGHRAGQQGGRQVQRPSLRAHRLRAPGDGAGFQQPIIVVIQRRVEQQSAQWQPRAKLFVVVVITPHARLKEERTGDEL